MAENSKIEWTDHTFNPWRGCTKVHEGCAHCYAETMSKRNPGTLGIWGPNGTRVVASEAMWKEPVKWNKKAEKTGKRPRVFCASLADVFEDWKGDVVDHSGFFVFKKPGAAVEDRMKLNDVRKRLFRRIDDTPNLDWLLLTKRPENIRGMWPTVHCEHCAENSCAFHRADLAMGGNAIQFRPNVWLGTSISTQEHADKQIPELLQCRDLSQVLFLSIEPLLGPIDIARLIRDEWQCPTCKVNGWFRRTNPGIRRTCATCGSRPVKVRDGIDWVIVGGESGPNARPMYPDWVRSIRDQCVAAGVAFHFKQWGEWMPVFHGIDPNKGDPNCRIKAATKIGDQAFWNVGKKAAGRLLDGKEWSQFPEVAHA